MNKTIMTDDERIAQIENFVQTICNSVTVGMPFVNLPMSVPDIEFLLRVIRDQRAELVQARQAITNMRQHIDVQAENNKQHLVAIAASFAAIEDTLK